MPTNSKPSTTGITISDKIKNVSKLIIIPNDQVEPIITEKEVAKIQNFPDNSTTQRNESNKIENTQNIDDLIKFNEKTIEIQKKQEQGPKFKNVLMADGFDKVYGQSENCKDLEDKFGLLENRMPDLTDEEINELNKEGAMPWNFLKNIDMQRNVSVIKSQPVLSVTPIYITVPIVIYPQSTLPINLAIGGHKISAKMPNLINSKETPINGFHNKQVNSDEPPDRQTNRHRSNFRKKIYERNSNHQVEEFEYKTEEK